jgi:poly-gamma-glutamate capsule biosynthesis protein CapA/YwtB (metallophosphatase superfamily)
VFTGYGGTIRGRHGGWPMKSSFLHVSDPLVLDCLKSLGFDFLSLRNNHAYDLGGNLVTDDAGEGTPPWFAPPWCAVWSTRNGRR